jgi:hypothetical protein
MATNVSQQDETLHKVIEWCDQREVEGLRLANALLQKHDLAAYAVVKAQIDAYHKTAEHCRSMLGYSGSMPSCLNYEDIDDSSPDLQPQVGDYGVAVLENAHGQEEIPFHVEREEHTGLPVALLNTRLYAETGRRHRRRTVREPVPALFGRLYVESDGPKAEQRRSAPPTDAEVEAVAKRLCWNSCEWDGIESDCVAKDEDDAWDYAGEIPGFQEEYIRQAKEMLEIARKAVSE